jgi:hypothetical protein
MKKSKLLNLNSKKILLFGIFTNSIKNIFTLILLFFSLSNLYSQTSKPNPQLVSKEIFLKSLSSSNSKSAPEYNHVINLLNNLNSSVYLLNGEEYKSYGEQPICMFTDLKSLSNANQNDLPTSDIELVTINIDKDTEINGSIDLSTICNYKNVKYIHIKFSFNVDTTKLSSLIKNCNPKSVIFYSIEIPS